MAAADPTTPRAAGRDPAPAPASTPTPTGAPSPTPARRGALSALLALAAAPAVAVTPEEAAPADAALIAACAEACDAQGRLDALLRDHPARCVAEEQAQAPVADALHARMLAATILAASLPAFTAAGLLAKGRAALAVGDKDFEGRNVAADEPGRLMLAAVEDLVELMHPHPPA